MLAEQFQSVIRELSEVRRDTLHARSRDVQHLASTMVRQTRPVPLLLELLCLSFRAEVGEGHALGFARLQVHRQEEVVDTTRAMSIEVPEQMNLGKSGRDVANHQCHVVLVLEVR